MLMLFLGKRHGWAPVWSAFFNVCGMGKRQEEVEICMQLKAYGLTGLMQMWWDSLHNGRTALCGHRCFRTPKLGLWGGGVALYAREQQECMELWLRLDDEPAQSLCMKISADQHELCCHGCLLQTIWSRKWMRLSSDSSWRSLMFAVSVCHEGPEALQCFKEWQHRNRSFLEYIWSKSLTQMIRESTKEDVLLYLTLKNYEDLLGDLAARTTGQPAATMGHNVLERVVQDKKNDHNPGLQKIRPWTVHSWALKNILACGPGEAPFLSNLKLILCFDGETSSSNFEVPSSKAEFGTCLIQLPEW